MEDLSILIETQRIRQKVDLLPVLSTAYLDSEAEWRRAHSMLALIAQGYIWTGPEPSQVSVCRLLLLVNQTLSQYLASPTSCYYSLPTDF